jgi:hypothetical protein
VTVIRDFDSVRFDRQFHKLRVGVIRVLDQLGECNVRFADEALTEFAEESCVNLE